MEISSGGQTNRSLAASGSPATRRTGTKFLTAIARKRHVSSPLTHDKLGVLGPSQVHPDSQTRLSIGHIQQRDRSHPAFEVGSGHSSGIQALGISQGLLLASRRISGLLYRPLALFCPRME